MKSETAGQRRSRLLRELSIVGVVGNIALAAATTLLFFDDPASERIPLVLSVDAAAFLFIAVFRSFGTPK
jgi:hypothetical protein